MTSYDYDVTIWKQNYLGTKILAKLGDIKNIYRKQIRHLVTQKLKTMFNTSN